MPAGSLAFVRRWQLARYLFGSGCFEMRVVVAEEETEGASRQRVVSNDGAETERRIQSHGQLIQVDDRHIICCRRSLDVR